MIVKSWLNFLNQYVFWSIMQNLLLSYISFAFLAAGISYIVVGAWIPKYCKISYCQGNKFVVVSFKKGFWETLLWIFPHFESIQCMLLIIVCLFDIQLKNITLYTIYWKLTSGYCEKKQHSSSRSSNTLWSKK